jgi:mono/diheme cytochrome c family protein
MRMILTVAAIAAISCGAAFGADATAGKAVYEKSCKGCHGATGTPSAGMVKAMGIKDFTITAYDDASIKTAVTAGKGKMKPVAGVSGAALDNVSAYVQSLKK